MYFVYLCAFVFASSYVSYVSLFTSMFESSKVHCSLSNQIGHKRISMKSFQKVSYKDRHELA